MLNEFCTNGLIDWEKLVKFNSEKYRVYRMSNNEQGSMWRKWDMHIHSLTTHMRNEYNSTTRDQFVKKTARKRTECSRTY